MVVVFGGAYNGKLEFIKDEFKIGNEEIFYCQGNEIDFSKTVISGIHKFTYSNIIDNKSSLEYIRANISLFKGKIIICDEISSGIVPLEREHRVWREETGKCLQYLSKEADKVIRVFCGIPLIIKGNENNE